MFILTEFRRPCEGTKWSEHPCSYIILFAEESTTLNRSHTRSVPKFYLQTVQLNPSNLRAPQGVPFSP